MAPAAVLAHAALGKEFVHRQGVHLRPGTMAMALSNSVPCCDGVEFSSLLNRSANQYRAAVAIAFSMGR